jgi:hypothetical protein
MKPLCQHAQQVAEFTVSFLEDRGIWMADVQVRCAACGVRFRWIGKNGEAMPMGLDLTGGPMTSVDGFELRCRIEPDAHMTSLMAMPLTQPNDP